MQKIITAALLVMASIAAHADYIYDAKSMDRWQRVDTHTIILMRGSTPKALVKLPYCYIYSSSTITVLNDDLGSYQGKILVDSEVCEVQSVTKL